MSMSLPVQRSLSALVFLLSLSCLPVQAGPSVDRAPQMVQVKQCHALLTSAPQTSLQMARALLAGPSPLPTPVEIGAVGCLGIAMRSMGQLDQTVGLPERLLAAAARADASAEDQLRANSMAAHLLLWRGEHAQALALTNASLEDAVRQRDVQAQIGALLQIALIRGDAMGDPQGALTYLQRATELSQHSRRPPNPNDLLLYYNYGYALLSMQRYEEALSAFDRVDAIGARISGQDVLLRRVGSHRAEIDRARGQLDRAEAGWRKVQGWQATHDPQGHIVTLQRQAQLALDRDQAAAALVLAEQAQALAESGHFTDERRAGLDLLGDVHTLLGHRIEALQLARQARELDQARSKGEALNQLAKLQATAERRIDPAEANAVQDLDRVRVLRNGAVVALLAVLLVATALVMRLRRQRRQLATLSRTDAVTGLPNRHDAERLLSAHANTREPQRSALILLEIDAFKTLNERHGQAAGDAALRAVARCLRQTGDRRDLIARWSGAGFLIARHDTAAPAAQALANQLRLSIERLVVEAAPGQSLTLSASLGLAPLPLFANHPARLDDSLRAADRALQSARRSGRNAWASLWGETAGPDLDLHPVLHDPARWMAQGWLSLAGSRPMPWSPLRDAQGPVEASTDPLAAQHD